MIFCSINQKYSFENCHTEWITDKTSLGVQKYNIYKTQLNVLDEVTIFEWSQNYANYIFL